jgi:hypothetical protein
MKMPHEVEGGSSLWEALRYIACCSNGLKMIVHQLPHPVNSVHPV